MATMERDEAAQHHRHALNTQAPYSYTIPQPGPSDHQLCPPHWRIREKRSKRSKLKELVLKLPAESGLATIKRHKPPSRPPIMRMKDSDDYLTARAANPYTGLVSPSVGSPSPCTPDTPGQALSQRKVEPSSPTPNAHVRPVLSRAKEGRKVSAGSVHKWRAGIKGWTAQAAVASPRETNATAGASVLVTHSEPDRFVVHMPSAAEPQPYFYPGCSSAEIKAFEHYKRKTRKVSGEGYSEQSGKHGHAVASGVRGMPDIRVAKRPQARVNRTGHHEHSSTPGPALSAATFAPFASPQTPTNKVAEVEPTAMRTVHAPPKYLDPLTPIESGPIRRKPVGSPKTADLSLLPPIRLVHPELASLPRPPTVSRSCSLGCERNDGTGDCHITARRPHEEGDTTLFPPKSVSRDSVVDRDTTAEILSAAVAYAVKSCRAMRFPRIDILSALNAPNATPRQKVDALRELLSLGAQVFAFLMVLSMLWRLGTAVVQLLELVFWPLIVPLKVVRWVAGVA
ncbi:hypothetical protein LTR56_003502 [Elasticomyces elasticus]|nr:hypothetical protein LTR22_010978 [Elasticomyces elasticus]KAK3655495.1 hypothetical protein LTR56_003502 [Elasticomyces elasticus]KAK5756750.1 hypothetical protein LTS12_013214 [Elasticomyces elasticus]